MSEDMGKKMGFRSRNPSAMTHAEHQQKYRRKLGYRQWQIDLTPEVAACLIYLRKEWGMKSNREVAEAALRFLTVCTRQGLQRLPQTMED